MNPQEDRLFFFLGSDAAAMSSLRVTSQQPCHADVGLFDGGHLWRRHTCPRPFQYKTRHCISGCGRVVFSRIRQEALSASVRRKWLYGWLFGIVLRVVNCGKKMKPLQNGYNKMGDAWNLEMLPTPK